jgi:hypothetical protein
MTASANGSTLTGPTSTGSLTDATGGVWTLTGGVVYLNGKAAGTSYNVATVEYANGIIYQENTSKAWYEWINGTWSATTAPVVAAPPTPTTPTYNVTLKAGESLLITFPDGAQSTFTAS